MQTIEVDGRKFHVLKTLNLEKFRDQQAADEYVKGLLVLRQVNSNTIHIVDEIIEAKFEDIIDAPAEVSASGSYNQTEIPVVGENVDVKL
jgi:hypothetical protein